jgi:multicomponent Na+:H+ antiporter subunit G
MLALFGSLFALGGAVFVLLAGVGALRFPDSITRMAAISKASTLGVALIAIGAGFGSGSWEVALKMGSLLVFLFLSSPVAAHLLGRAAKRAGVPLAAATQNIHLWKR